MKFFSPFKNTIVKIQGGYPNYNSWHQEYGGANPAQSNAYHGAEDWTPYDNSNTSDERNWYLYPIFPDEVTGNVYFYSQPAPLPAGSPSYYSKEFINANPLGVQLAYTFIYEGYAYLVKYCHLEPDSVPVQYRVSNASILSGSMIAITGKTGNVKTSREGKNAGRHLHIELYRHAGTDINNWNLNRDRVRPSEYILFLVSKTTSVDINKEGQVYRTESYLSFDTRNSANAIFITPNGSMVHICRPPEVDINQLTNYYITVSTFDPYFYTDKLIEIINQSLNSAIERFGDD